MTAVFTNEDTEVQEDQADRFGSLIKFYGECVDESAYRRGFKAGERIGIWRGIAIGLNLAVLIFQLISYCLQKGWI